MQDQPQVTPPKTKPRIALMGEFSAGKSTLANLLLEQPHSPVQVTATQLPPVWYSHGAGGAHRIALNGDRTPIAGGDWTATAPEDTQLIQVELEADILQSADLIDLPGTSDPSLATRYWETLVPQVDLVIWCTPSNQAWRQSEAALWETVPPELQSRSLLLITRMDKIRAEVDKARILHRVTNETSGLFKKVLPISLVEALSNPGNEAVMEDSGAADMVRFLIRAHESIGLTSRPAYVPAAPRRLAARRARPAPVRTEGSGVIVPRQITRRRRAILDQPSV